MINWKIELDLLWRRNCVLSENDANLNDATFQINSTKLCVPVTGKVLSFKVGENDPTGNCFNNYYMPLVEIKEFKALINNNRLVINNWHRFIKAFHQQINFSGKLKEDDGFFIAKK